MNITMLHTTEQETQTQIQQMEKETIPMIHTHSQSEMLQNVDDALLTLYIHALVSSPLFPRLRDTHIYNNSYLRMAQQS